MCRFLQKTLPGRCGRGGDFYSKKETEFCAQFRESCY